MKLFNSCPLVGSRISIETRASCAPHWQTRTHNYIDFHSATHENHINWENQPSRISQRRKNKILLEQFSIVDSVGRRRNPRWSERRNISDTRQFVWLREKISSATDSAGERAGNGKKGFNCVLSRTKFRIIQFANCLAIAGRANRRQFGGKGKKSFFSLSFGNAREL